MAGIDTAADEAVQEDMAVLKKAELADPLESQSSRLTEADLGGGGRHLQKLRHQPGLERGIVQAVLAVYGLNRAHLTNEEDREGGGLEEGPVCGHMDTAVDQRSSR